MKLDIRPMKPEERLYIYISTEQPDRRTDRKYRALAR